MFWSDLPQNEKEMRRKKIEEKKQTPLLRWKLAQLSFFVYVKDKVVHILMRYKYKRPKLNGN